MSELLTSTEAARELGVHRDTTRRAAASGQVPGAYQEPRPGAINPPWVATRAAWEGWYRTRRPAGRPPAPKEENRMRMVIQQLWPGDHAPGEWKVIGHATTLRGASRIAKRHYDPEGFGGLRHPDGDPRYGTIRAVQGDTVLRWDPSLDAWEEWA